MGYAVTESRSAMASDDFGLRIEDDLFSFETDHLALKGNKDYSEVLKTLVVLTAQREQALKDYKRVAELKAEALRDPLETLERVRKDGNLGLPPMHHLPKLPAIDFQKYDVAVPQHELKEIYSDPQVDADDKLDVKPQNVANNNVWTPEEQKRLEELLHVYPPEPIEMRRFQKIAKALGNRTVHQVSSRVQKYFVKLFKAGLPIPGRIPKSGEKYKKSALHKHQRHNHYLWKPSTFFPDLCVPVQMDPLNDAPGPSCSTSGTPGTDDTACENYLLPSEYARASPQATSSKDHVELQLELLRRIRLEKEKENGDDYAPQSHAGFRCDYCDEEPIVGARWHCATCADSVDFCTDCVVAQMYSDAPHPLTHWLVVYAEAGVAASNGSRCPEGDVFQEDGSYGSSE
ncbi:ZZ-type zinc finger-containing protein 3 [Cylas formicarius]|uniref:ZZ-type zinc finger-containing protein 3 n=1 Tax=Cylas formicarius TaxID=197179 RepID=UPI00295836B9|nr:ZZ-type zinc finger-containing protein 3 [Cylas formicarius]